MKRFVLPALALALLPAAAHAQEVQVQGSVQVGAAAPPPPPQQPVVAQPQPVYVQQPVYQQQPVYGQPVYAQPTYYPPARRMRVVPYNGGPIPPGATLRTRRHTGLVVGGAVLFGVPYLISLSVGAFCTDARYGCQAGIWYMVPVLGPIITGAQTNGGLLALGMVDAIVQAGGLTMFILGLAMSNQELVVYGENDTHRNRRATWSVAPVAAGANIGATLSVAHF